jgi:LysM repeat protein
VLRGAARGKDGITTIRVPPGKGEVLLQKLDQGAPLPAVNLTLKHKVKRGETLTGIAAHYGVSSKRLAAVNGVGRKHPLRTGMVLTVPAGLHPPAPAALEPGDPRASTGYVPERVIRTPATLDGQSTTEGRKTVIVKRGQTLAMIAEEHGVTVADIKRWNHLPTVKVRPGQYLKLREPDAPEVTLAAADSSALAKVALRKKGARRGSASAARGGAAGKAPSGAILVRAGDTLERIAKRNGTTVEALKRANGLPSSKIRAGQRLKLPRG